MDAKTLFEQCIKQADQIMKQVKVSRFSLPTPDTEWDIHDLLNHIFYELSWVSQVLSGKTITEVGTKYDDDLVDSHFQETWATALSAARKAVEAVSLDKMVHCSFGEVTAGFYIEQESNDQFIHAWDLGTAIHNPPHFNEEVATQLYETVLPHKDSLASTGLFAPVVSVPESADIQTKLLAIFGRTA
jgi:uncharacterized protein (TIGR03086 family)